MVSWAALEESVFSGVVGIDIEGFACGDCHLIRAW